MSYGASAYARVAQTALSPREAEAAVLIKAAGRLQAIQADWVNQAPALNEALNFNQKVWTIIAGAATAPESPLPVEIKNNIAELSTFVFKRMIDTLIEPSAEKLTALISIKPEHRRRPSAVSPHRSIRDTRRSPPLSRAAGFCVVAHGSGSPGEASRSARLCSYWIRSRQRLSAR